MNAEQQCTGGAAIDHDETGVCNHGTAPELAAAVPAVGDRYVKRAEPDRGRVVTVSRVWAAGDDGHTAVAYDWGDRGQCGSACPLGVFLGTYEPYTEPAEADAAADTVTVTVEQVEAALRGYLAMLDYDLHKNLECGEETGEDTYAEEAADLFGRLRAEVAEQAAQGGEQA